MVRVIFKRWPHLQQIFNNDHNANEIFRFHLRMYFRNARKKMSDVIPEVLSKRAIFGKRKSDNDDLPHATVKLGVMACGIENYLNIITGWGRSKHYLFTQSEAGQSV